MNQSVRLHTQQTGNEPFEYRCDLANHLRTPDNITATGQCRLCKSTTHKKSRWIKHEVTVQQQPKTALEQAVDLHFEVFKQRQRDKEVVEQQELDRKRQRAAQQASADAAFSLMDADATEIKIVTNRLAGRKCPASVYVAEIRKLRAKGHSTNVSKNHVVCGCLRMQMRLSQNRK